MFANICNMLQGYDNNILDFSFKHTVWRLKSVFFTNGVLRKVF